MTITPFDAENVELKVGRVAYRPFPTGGYDIAQRLKDMDTAKVDVQVFSATPQTYLYNLGDDLSPVVAATQNDQMAKHVALHRIEPVVAPGVVEHQRAFGAGD